MNNFLGAVMRSWKRRGGLFTTVAAVGAGLAMGGVHGCASAEKSDQGLPPAVFLQSTSGLRASPDHDDRWYDLSSSLGGYRAFIVERPEVLLRQSLRGTVLTREQKESLAAEYEKEMVASLSAVYAVTSEPGPGVARIRSAITSVARSVGAGSGARQTGGAGREMEIVDSLSGVRLAAVIEREQAEDDHVPVTDSPFHDARATFTHWSARLTLMLRDIDRLATRP